MKTDELPSYEIIKSLKKAGFIAPEDRPWKLVNLPINNQAFLKYECGCLVKYFNKIREGGIEVILKPYCYSENRKRVVFYCAQCSQCQTVYYCFDDPNEE